MSLEWSGWRDSNSRFPAPEAGGLAATLQPGVPLGELDVRVVMLSLFRADRAGDRKVLETFAPHPVMDEEDTEQPREPSPLRPLPPGRRNVRHRPIVPEFLEGPVGVEPTLAEPQSAVPPQHFGPLVGPEGIAPSFLAYQASVLLLNYEPKRILERVTGFEPVLEPWQGSVLPSYTTRA